MIKKQVVLGLGLLGIIGTAIAGGTMPAKAPDRAAFQPGILLGLQLGVGNSHMQDFPSTAGKLQQHNFGSRVYAGYQFTRNLGLQAGFTYILNTQYAGSDVKNTYIGDLVGVISAGGIGTRGVMNTGVGIYAKAGIGYAHMRSSGFSTVLPTGKTTRGAWNPVWGGGLTYTFKDIRNLAVDASFMQHNGHRNVNKSDFMPPVDLYSLGVQYLFNV